MSSGRYTLTVDLDAIAQNWARLNALTSQAVCSAVVKADGYGLGAVAVSRRLFVEGCRVFCVSSLDEAVELRDALGDEPDIYVLSGIFPGEERMCVERNLIPTLVSLEMLDRWLGIEPNGAQAALKIDTGMGRLGISESELDALLAEPRKLRSAGVRMIISHLACADLPSHALNAQQLQRFNVVRDKLQAVDSRFVFSLANSAGVMLGDAFHFDMVRPGLALYGVQPTKASSNVRPAVSLYLSIIQLRYLKAGESAGYGAEFVARRDTCLAVAAGGYADGIFRALGVGKGRVFVAGTCAPIVGRVSMDSILVDVTELGLDKLSPSEWPRVELVGPHQGVDSLAAAADTVSYEYLTSLGQRFARRYIGEVGIGEVGIGEAGIGEAGIGEAGKIGVSGKNDAVGKTGVTDGAAER